MFMNIDLNPNQAEIQLNPNQAEIQYTPPQINCQKNRWHTHLLSIHQNGIEKGWLEYLYLNGVYYLFYMQVYDQFRGQGLSTNLLNEFNSMLIKKSSVGLLRNIIDPNLATRCIYSNHGWHYLNESSNWMTFGNFSNANRLNRIITHINNLEERGAFMLPFES